ncbi:MAG TPA: sigma-70 family RNA polymerase sigma factor [Chloroflexia bacterium]|nr:sigma-70 family RNA polymerase sigma factor [Chloroflexia bacterium]
MEEHEAEAIRRLKQGDIGGLEALVRLYQAQALDAAYVVTRNHPIAEDVVQGAFLRAYDVIEGFDANRSFGPWFLRSVVNDALKAVTRRQTVSLDGAREEPDRIYGTTKDVYEPYEIVEAAQTREALWAALDRLSPIHRAAIVMRYYLDLSDAEISQMLGVPTGTVRRRLHDGRKRLRDLLPSWVRR